MIHRADSKYQLMSNFRIFATFVGVGILSTGCIPLPFVSPPVRLSGAFGGGSSGLPAETKGAEIPRGRAVGRLALSPLSFSSKYAGRVVDPELGMVFEGILGAPEGDSPEVGGYIGMAWNVWRRRYRDSTAGHRVYLRGMADFLSRNPGNGIGGGGALSIGWEYSGYVSQDFFSANGNASSPLIFGVAHGEGGVGFELTGAGRAFDNHTAYWQLTLGMTVRIPASFGIMLVPVYSKSR